MRRPFNRKKGQGAWPYEKWARWLDEAPAKEETKLSMVRKAPDGWRRRRAHDIASAAAAHDLNRSDPYTYSRVFNLAYQGIV